MSSQRTIASEAHLAGAGLHSGEPVRLTFRPAEPDTGLVFVRTDLPDRPSLRAHPDRLVHRPRRTAMAEGEIEVHTTEHLLAATTGLGIDNLVIELDAQELPACDGSAKEFVEVLRAAGLVDQDVARAVFDLPHPVSVSKDGASIVALPYKGFKITYTLDDHGGALSGSQMIELDVDEDSFCEQIAPARTFCLKQEAEALLAARLVKGANAQNTCIIDGDRLVDNQLRFADEPARHKVLDLIGDLAFSTRRINAHIIAVRSGHAHNMALVQRINDQIEAESKPAFVFDIDAILKHLPHRYPFLLVDKIVDFRENEYICGIKNVTINEPFFAGHFPGYPVMPGVLQVEAMAQTGALVLLTNPANEGKIPLFMSLDKVKFRRAVRPGDQLRIEVEVIRNRPRMSACRAKITVDGQLVCEAEIRSVLASPDQAKR
jgi:UDP-3-O-[3-hydroxymyristoyl] N-acetylglucosamine deacetylase/3-hydroxyacyl-[acyl-carrier-protein] dehydratase